MTPVFGTAQPLRGMSGAIRSCSCWGIGSTCWSRVEAIAQGRPDNIILETGVLREFKNGAYRTRFGQYRADLKHQPIDLVLWAAPYLMIGAGLYVTARAIKGRRSDP
jgi:hypothetical protein